MKQRILSIFIAAVMIVMLIPSTVFAYGEAEVGHNHADGYCFVCRQGDTSQIVTDETYEEGAPAVAW